jgi:hypothetical protein
MLLEMHHIQLEQEARERELRDAFLLLLAAEGSQVIDEGTSAERVRLSRDPAG